MMQPPKEGDRMAVQCRGHWHVGWLAFAYDWDAPSDELGFYEVISTPMKLVHAEKWVNHGE